MLHARMVVLPYFWHEISLMNQFLYHVKLVCWMLAVHTF